MGFREAVAAGDVALPQVRRCGCRRMHALTPKLSPEVTVKSLGTGAARSFSYSVLQLYKEGIFCSCSLKLKCLCFSFQVREELEAQLSRFRELLGRDPTHVDGHQHVHVLPGSWVQAPRSGGFAPR